MSAHEKTVRFGLVALLCGLAPRAAIAQPATAPAAATAAQPAEAPAVEAEPAQADAAATTATAEAEASGDVAADASLEDYAADEGGGGEEFEPPFLGFAFGGGMGTFVDLQRRDLCSEFAGCKAHSGVGMDFFVSARFSPMFKLVGGYDIYWHQGTLDGVDHAAILQAWRLDGRLTFPNRTNLEPFAQVGLGFYTYGDELAVDTAGPGLQAGGGVDFAFARWLSGSVTVLYRGFRLDTLAPALGIEKLMNVHAITANLGVSFGPGI